MRGPNNSSEFLNTRSQSPPLFPSLLYLALLLRLLSVCSSLPSLLYLALLRLLCLLSYLYSPLSTAAYPKQLIFINIHSKRVDYFDLPHKLTTSTHELECSHVSIRNEIPWSARKWSDRRRIQLVLIREIRYHLESKRIVRKRDREARKGEIRRNRGRTKILIKTKLKEIEEE